MKITKKDLSVTISVENECESEFLEEYYNTLTHLKAILKIELQVNYNLIHLKMSDITIVSIAGKDFVESIKALMIALNDIVKLVSI